MSLHPRPLFNAVVLGTAAALLAGCGERISEQEMNSHTQGHMEKAATVLKSNDRMQGRLIAYSRYYYFRSGKYLATDHTSTLVPDLAACQMHGEYQALQSQLRHGGQEVKLFCLGLDGNIAAQFTCTAEDNNPSCRSFNKAGDRVDVGNRGVKYPKLD